MARSGTTTSPFITASAEAPPGKWAIGPSTNPTVAWNGLAACGSPIVSMCTSTTPTRCWTGAGRRRNWLPSAASTSALTAIPLSYDRFSGAPMMAWSPDEFTEQLREVGRQFYHDKHPFHRLMNDGRLGSDQIRLWVANRFY